MHSGRFDSVQSVFCDSAQMINADFGYNPEKAVKVLTKSKKWYIITPNISIATV